MWGFISFLIPSFCPSVYHYLLFNCLQIKALLCAFSVTNSNACILNYHALHSLYYKFFFSAYFYYHLPKHLFSYSFTSDDYYPSLFFFITTLLMSKLPYSRWQTTSNPSCMGFPCFEEGTGHPWFYFVTFSYHPLNICVVMSFNWLNHTLIFECCDAC